MTKLITDEEVFEIQRKMINPKTLRTIIGALLIIFIIVLGTLFLKLMKENAKCEMSPFVYGAQKTYEGGFEVMCSCTSLDPEYAGFYFDKDGLEVKEHLGYSLKINFTP